MKVFFFTSSVYVNDVKLLKLQYYLYYSQFMKINNNNNNNNNNKKLLKGYFTQKNVITPWFTHPHAILGVYAFLLSDEYSQSYVKKYKYILALELYNCSEWGLRF